MEGALRSHTLTHCDEGRKTTVEVDHGMAERDTDAGLKNSEIEIAPAL